MSQVTQDLCDHIINYADRGERFPLTVNELRQLAYRAKKDMERAQHAGEAMARIEAPVRTCPEIRWFKSPQPGALLYAAPQPAEVPEDVRDAARYRFLRHADLDALAESNWGTRDVYEGEAFDAAIDAAIAAAPQQGSANE